MDTSLLVENLPLDMDDDALAAAFAAHGTVVRAAVQRDRASGASTGCGVVEMESAEQAVAARAALDATSLGGATVRVGPVPAPARIELAPVTAVEKW